ncbi:tyrosine-type recombinase/integrase [Stakelama tenebrarum]|uniref:Integrase arm-type DNA-binding domain-containing protein n=1 Tax=Stakelama tenebrarum TaxID=2711215 RepID=A0A6G6Y5C2_9SPHN|nr:integrase arm-type DNA-binding domain-containing protein [Sphingosinithalassobacter tenebrarum]QIG80132.1 integrase arm-type DNA-binding domain-containing protein [Sphingosinithalassobacter tenebrarum]
MLTDRECRSAKPREKPYKLGDAGGLYLYVTPAGAKSWRMKYRIAKREKRLTFGLYPEVTLQEARELRDRARKQIRDGIDPSIARKQTRAQAALSAETTFRAIAEEWHATYKSGWNARYARQILDRLENHVFPAIGSVPIAQVTAAMVLQAIRKVESSGAIEMAHRVRQHTSDVFVHGISTGRCEDDPAHVIAKALKPVPKRLWPAVRTIEDAREVLRAVEMQSAARQTKLASRLMALTAVRSGPLRNAAPSEFEGLDGPEPVWRIPAAKMKLSRERKADAGYEFVVPLSTWSAELVRGALRIAGPNAVFLFPSSRDPKKPLSDSTISAVYLDAGLRDRHVPHGWRATFSTIMNERAAVEDRERDRAIIDLMLAHVPDGVEAAYNRAAYMPRRRQLAQAWGDMLMEGLPPTAILLGNR